MGKKNEVDLVSSRVYPTLERKPGGPDNWVEATGGLPGYIERIAKHLHYEQGMSISRSIAVAVNTVKRWAKGGTVTSHGTTKRITPATQAKAAAAVAQWEAKKARARAKRAVNLSVVDLSISALEKFRGHKCSYCKNEATKAILWAEHRAVHITCDDHLAQGKKRIAGNMGGVEKVSDLSHLSREDKIEILASGVIDLARLTKDGRKSFKNRGKWKHGFIPVDTEAKVAKAKGSPIAMKRMNRLYQGKPVKEGVKAIGGKERTSTGRAATLRHAKRTDSATTQKFHGKNQAEKSKGGGKTARARKPWESIPESAKTTRNGKRYVISIYRGQQQLVEWEGQNAGQAAPDPATRVLRSLRMADAKNMTTAQIRRLLRVTGQPDSVKKVLNQALAAKVKEKK